MRGVLEDFSSGLDPRWERHVEGNGALELTESTLRFVNHDTPAQTYTNAQIDDYEGLPRRRFPWRPPLRLTVRARFSHPMDKIRGTAGFGFWNDPFLMTEPRMPTLPRALWFFYASPPSNMKLDLGVAGYGWKAAVIDALRPSAILLMPLALPAALTMNLPTLYRRLWPSIQRALNVQEALIDVDWMDWHTYLIEWGTEHVSFQVDGESVLEDAPSPQGALGFVMWLDNQYMVVKPWGRFGWGVLEKAGKQWMEVERLAIEPSGG